ncbi:MULTISPECIES: AAA family ATPase [Sorangium]|uniref:AAA family ATPase n=1 Tax=Sorangium TaxID=39643 RepID=UPI003D9C024B
MPITELRVEGLRTIEKARLKLDGLTVLIGENGSGKSSLIEACELLRRARSERFLDELYSIHGGFNALLRQGAPRLRLGATLTPTPGIDKSVSPSASDAFESFEYDLALAPSGPLVTIEETLRGKLRDGRAASAGRGAKRSPGTRSRVSKEPNKPVLLFQRRGEEVIRFHLDGSTRLRYTTGAQQTVLSEYGGHPSHGERDDEAAQHTVAQLDRIRVHLPFEVIPAWAGRALDRKSALRTSMVFAPATQLEKLGANLANAYHALKNSFDREHWRQTLEYVRLGLGAHVEDVATWADPGGGYISLALKLRGLDQQIPVAQISDGMLAYLALVAAFRLHITPPSLLAFDEPDLHLHPHLLMRALDFFESMAREFPVLVATHSDRLLDGLSDPARSVVLCSLDERQATQLVRPDPAALERWLERYRGLGDIRAAGHAASVLTRVEPA